MKWIDGNKTYLGMIAYGIVMVIESVKPGTVPAWVLPLVLTWTGLSVRHAMKKMEP